MNKAIFLDRDGVINELVYHEEQEVIDSPFTVRQFKLIPGVPEFIKTVRQADFKVVVVSNQPGIAKGNMTAVTFKKIREKMRTDLAGAGAAVDGEYYCLHHPNAQVAKYRVECDCRKPKPGMLLHAALDLDIDLPQSWMIGDNLSDVQAGQSAGCCTVLIANMKSELLDLIDKRKITPDYICRELKEAVKTILIK